MPRRLAGLLNGGVSRKDLASAVERLERRYDPRAKAGAVARKAEYGNLADTYYDLATDFYEYGWGRSFHFAPRAPQESFRASITRHQHFIAHMLGLRPGMRVADLGCGVGGPLREIARFSGAKILGVNINAYQIEKARIQTTEEGPSDLADYVVCDFSNVDEPDGSFDAVYSIESTCHAADRESVFGEALRLLKPGGRFAAYEWCMTDRFDPVDPHHVRLKNDIEAGTGVPDLVHQRDIVPALREVGFELLEAHDLAERQRPGIPWYEPLVGSGLSLAGFRSSRTGRKVTYATLRFLEVLRVVPRGSPRVSRILDTGAAALAEAGRLEIFTPMYFVLARRPE